MTIRPQFQRLRERDFIDPGAFIFDIDDKSGGCFRRTAEFFNDDPVSSCRLAMMGQEVLNWRSF